MFAKAHDGQPEPPRHEDGEGIIPVEGEGRPWWKRKKIIWSIVALALLIIIALAVGLGVALTRDNGSSDKSGSDNSGSG